MRTISRHGTNLTKNKGNTIIIIIIIIQIYMLCKYTSTCACNIKMNYILRKNRNESTVLLFNAYSESGTHLCTCKTHRVVSYIY
jgi:hypothetical protein